MSLTLTYFVNISFSEEINVETIDIIRSVDVSLCSNCSKRILQASASVSGMRIGCCKKQLSVHINVKLSDRGGFIELTVFQNVLLQFISNAANLQEDQLAD